MARSPRSLLDALKAARPAVVRVHLADESTRDVAVPATRQRWQHVEGVLEGLPWTSVEMLDHKARVVGAPWVRDEAPTALEDIEGGAGGKRPAEVTALVQVIVRAQEMVLQRHNEALRPILDATRVLLTDLGGQVVELRREHVQAMARERELVTALAKAAAAGAGDEDDAGLPKLAELAPLLLALGGGGMLQRPAPKAATPPNGKPSGASKAAGGAGD